MSNEPEEKPMRCTDARVMIRTMAVLVSFALASGLTGCSASTRFEGRVIPGSAGLAVVVDPGDDRLQIPGVPDVEVALLRSSASNSGGAVLLETVTDAEGNFSLTLGRGQHPGGPVLVRTRGPGVFTSRSRAFLPRGSQKLLCSVMIDPGRPAASEPAPSP
jgi:hypothetical protein